MIGKGSARRRFDWYCDAKARRLNALIGEALNSKGEARQGTDWNCKGTASKFVERKRLSVEQQRIGIVPNRIARALHSEEK